MLAVEVADDLRGVLTLGNSLPGRMPNGPQIAQFKATIGSRVPFSSTHFCECKFLPLYAFEGGAWKLSGGLAFL